jgi:hypothetical protein
MRTHLLSAAMLLCVLFLNAQNSPILSESIQFNVANEIAMNSKHSEFGVSEWMGKVCFTTNRNQFDQKNNFLDEAAYNVVAFDDAKNYRKVYPLEMLASKTNVGSISKMVNGRFYFTAENNKSDYNLREATITKSMIIYEAQQTDGKWKINPLRIIKNKQDSYIHPTLSEDGKTMFFASDIAGGYGGMDLYVIHLVDGIWSEPVNLGPNVNTAESELFPFIHTSGKLMFSSNGHRGFGGMDIYITQQETTGWVAPENMGSPINTNADDFSMYVNNDFSQGYFASNREGGMGSDDIYSLSISEGVALNKNIDNSSLVLNALVGSELPEIISTPTTTSLEPVAIK